jgi:hypothetical protein
MRFINRPFLARATMLSEQLFACSGNAGPIATTSLCCPAPRDIVFKYLTL